MTFLDVWRRVRAICDYISSLYAISPDRMVSPPGPPAHYPQSPPAPQAAAQPPAALFLPVLRLWVLLFIPVPALVNIENCENTVENSEIAVENGAIAVENGEIAVENGAIDVENGEKCCGKMSPHA